MKLTIDEEVCRQHGMTLPEVLAVLLVKTGTNIQSLFEELHEKEVLVTQYTFLGEVLKVTQRWDDVCSNILLTSDKAVPNDDRIANLAAQLIQIFPKGKKEGTSTYWRSNTKDTQLRLKKFFKLYGNRYSDEQIITATTKYVESFNGDYSYMRILKYFIWKDAKKQDAEGNIYIEEISDLATFIENAGNEADLRNNWNTELK